MFACKNRCGALVNQDEFAVLGMLLIYRQMGATALAPHIVSVHRKR